ncbi:MAG: IS1096 element passenger TnpR family protein [Cuniculiplasma sp.]
MKSGVHSSKGEFKHKEISPETFEMWRFPKTPGLHVTGYPMFYFNYFHMVAIYMQQKKIRIYRFRISMRGRGSLWRKIDIRGDQTFGELDRIIRISFNLDTIDHLSEFYGGKKWYRSGFGSINPSGEGEGADLRIDSIGLGIGSKIGYVYDFGTETHFYVTLQQILEEESSDDHFPRVVSENKKKEHYCSDCASSGKKTLASMECWECSENAGKFVYLCVKCAESEKHEEHAMDDIMD